jgi:MFS family permease
VTGLLTRVVPSNERGLYMGVQHSYGGVSRVAFPIAAGFLMDHAGVGVPFWVSGLLVLVTLPLTWALVGYAVGGEQTTGERLAAAVAEITNEFPVVAPPDAKPASGG